MAAPSNTVWGSIAGDYGRIGISVTRTDSLPSSTFTVDIWFWSKYSVSDSNNTLFYDNLSATGSATTSAGSVSVSTTVASGSGWSTSNQVLLKRYTYTYSRTKTPATRYIYAKLQGIDRVGATMYASTTLSIPAKTTYTVTYNANGGTGAPSAQTKWYAEALTLQSSKPTRTGYTFKGWSTANDSSVEYAAGATYSTNASVTLYAVWQANTYTITYNANGGTGAPSAQTKTYGVALTLSSTKPTRSGYNFLGWALSSAATKATYAAGASYTDNANATLYAVWEVGYVKPRITNYSVVRGNTDATTGFTEDPTGSTMRIMFTYACDNSSIMYAVTVSNASGTPVYASPQNTLSDVSGDVVSYFTISLSSDASYTVLLTVMDNGGSSTARTTLSGALYPLDALAGGKGIAFGKPAELEGVADFAFEGKFNKAVYGKALGMDKVPSVPANSDLNNYIDPGCYAVYRNDAAETIDNIPIARAGRLEVWSATGEGVRTEQWSYLRQRYVPYNSANAVWEREITRGENNVWNYYDWWRSTLTPEASERVYSKAAMTASISANAWLSSSNAYTLLPMNTTVLSTSNRLTLSSNSIRIGEGIKYVKVSGQVLLKCGSISGNRHIRIQKSVPGGATTNIAWTCIHSDAGNNTLYAITPAVASVQEGDLIKLVYYTSDIDDYAAAGSSANGWQTYLTVEEL